LDPQFCRELSRRPTVSGFEGGKVLVNTLTIKRNNKVPTNPMIMGNQGC
jgi:hypothetical protein